MQAAARRALEQLEALGEVVAGEMRAQHALTDGPRLPSALLPEAMHYIEARRTGMAAETYARTYPQTFLQLWRAMGKGIIVTLIGIGLLL
jgi:hypothetical protein